MRKNSKLRETEIHIVNKTKVKQVFFSQKRLVPDFVKFLIKMLPYANQMFLDILHEDGLVVAAKGLGVEEVFFNLLKVYSDPGNLVLVIGANEEEEEYFLSRLKQEQVKAVPRKITTEFSAAERQRLYLEGGVLFITTRILVVEMLTERIPFGNF